MKTFLAPIYCQTNSLSQEKLTLGLIMFTADGTGKIIHRLQKARKEKSTGKAFQYRCQTKVLSIQLPGNRGY